jgi:hypothetical protein
MLSEDGQNDRNLQQVLKGPITNVVWLTAIRMSMFIGCTTVG